MANIKMFRNSLSGYNKEDVNNYIKETDLAHAEAIEALRAEASKANEQLEELTEQNKTLSKKVFIAEAEAGALRAEKAEIEERDAQINDKIRKYTDEIDTLKKELNFYKAEAEAQKNVISTLKAERDDLLREIEMLKVTEAPSEPQTEASNDENESNEEAEEDEEPIVEDKDSDQYKLDMYNKISSQLGDIIINANKTADEIVSRAKNEAEYLKSTTENEVRERRAVCDAEISKLKAESEEEAAYIRKRLSDIAEELLARVSSDLHNSIDSSVREINTYVSDVQFEIKALATKIETRSGEMYDRLGYYCSSVTDNISGRLTEMDKKYGIKNSSKEV